VRTWPIAADLLVTRWSLLLRMRTHAPMLPPSHHIPGCARTWGPSANATWSGWNSITKRTCVLHVCVCVCLWTRKEEGYVNAPHPLKSSECMPLSRVLVRCISNSMQKFLLHLPPSQSGTAETEASWCRSCGPSCSGCCHVWMKRKD